MKVSIVKTRQSRNISRQMIIGLDLGDRHSWYCVVDEVGHGEASQRRGASPSDGDSGASRVGANPHVAGEHSTGTDQELWSAVAQLQRAQHESGES